MELIHPIHLLMIALIRKIMSASKTIAFPTI